MNLLQILSNVCAAVNLPRPDTIINSTDDGHVQLLVLAKEEIRELVAAYPWAELQREASYTLVADQDAYTLPADFLKIIHSTNWNRTESQWLNGPLNSQEWQLRKSALVKPTIRQEFRLKGFGSKQLFIYPTPTAADAGQIVVWEYQSKMGVRPRDWSASTNFAAGSCCWSNDTVYLTASGGITGATAPVHSSGNISDGGVLWGPSTGLYEIKANTDEVLLDSHLLYLGTKYRFLRDKGLDYGFAETQYRSYLRSNASNFTGSQVLDFTPRYRDIESERPNIDEGSWS